VALVSACGGGGSSTSTLAPAVVTLPTTAEQCYTMTNGNVFRGQETTNPTQATLGVSPIYYAQYVRDTAIQAATYNSVIGQSRVATGTLTTTISGSTPTVAPINEVFSTVIAATYKYNRLATRTTPAGGTSTDTIYSNYLRSTVLAVGASENYTYTYTTTASPTINTVSHSLKLLAIEDLVTAAGTFKNTCKFSLTIAVPGPTSTTVSDVFWYAPGWGNVKEVVVENFTDGRLPATLTRTIEATAILKGTL
jgi:hypothetical protein